MQNHLGYFIAPNIPSALSTTSYTLGYTYVTMNRLCQSSYGNLEAVINITGYNGESQRKLVHFYRDSTTGQWSACDVVSHNPTTGGSMIQSVSKHHPDQVHGDFEVIVLEEDGALNHYTRDNTIPVDNGVYAWRLSATVNTPKVSKDRVVDMLTS